MNSFEDIVENYEHTCHIKRVSNVDHKAFKDTQENYDHTYYVKRVSDVDHKALDEALSEKIINWFPKCTELYPVKMPKSNTHPMNVTNAVSYYMFGETDVASSSKILLESLQSYEFHKNLYMKRWMHEDPMANFKDQSKMMQYLVLKPDLKHELFFDDTTFKLFIFIIANVVRRTIVVLSGNDNIQSIYMPLLSNFSICVRYPIILYENSKKFYPLLMDKNFENIPVIPLFTWHSKNLHSAFLLPEENSKDNICRLLQSYMVSGKSRKQRNNQLFAKLLPLSISDKSKFRDKCNYGGIQLLDTPLLETPLLHLAESEPTAPDYDLLTLKFSETNLGLTVEDEEEKPSLMRTTCKYPECLNFVSRYTAPYCYDHVHLADPIRQTSKVEDMNISLKFNEIMKESEERTKVAATLCLGAFRGCTNFGNSRCAGYCNECFSLILK
ncbi:hypothetical protein HELRODRAFT_163398 [Helobdella robusta]|uniref:A20-type domain-containing protein n=1 Tax=Helobdella robusta TaxID=6412 RepID=T1EU02_HELRO|nr:hypothetical protein HELRODRAFT_163398 [Helobdella robusta]ESN96347.1 hypothetical protein HELRODRAFT_163398 [Helobdella robusta]